VHPITQNSDKKRQRLDNVLVATVLAVSGLMWFCNIQDPWLLHLYYLPVVISGFYLGRDQARLLSLLCILTGTIVFVPMLALELTEVIPLGMLFAFGLWAAMLLSVAVVVGGLSDRWRAAMLKLNEAHQKDVLTDGLTGASSRRAFEHELSRKLSERRRSGAPLGLVLIDIDHFKLFNDRYGHDAGDDVLRQTARVLREAVREADMVARYGGEEFAILLPASDAASTQEVAERARRLIENRRFFYSGLRLRMTVSIGVAQVQANEEAALLIQRADAALYASKEAGRNRVHFHDGETCRQHGSGTTVVAAEVSGNSPAGRTDEGHLDAVTGLASREVLMDELRRRAAEINRYGGILSVGIVRMTNYHKTPDDAPHARKSLLATVGRLCISVLRDADLVARYEQDCLCVLLPSTRLRDSWTPLQRLVERAALHEDPKYPFLSYNVSVGIGELMIGEDSTDLLSRISEAVQSADEGRISPRPIENAPPGTVCSLAVVPHKVPQA
jgi:diguanylate cyclase (GGDEF)-like protein